MRAIRQSAVCLVSALLILPFLAVAQAPTKPQTPSREPQLRMLGKVRTVTIHAPVEVQQKLARKKAFNARLLQRSITYRQNTPVLRLKDGKQISLLPVEDTFTPTPQQREQSGVLMPNLAKYRQYIRVIKLDPNIINALLGRVVDHRSCQTAIRDQGDRGTCTAFASVAGIEGFEQCTKSISLDLSESHAYHVSMQEVSSTCPLDVGAWTYLTAQYLTDHRICTEALRPYTLHLADLPANDATHISAACTAAAKYGFTDTQIILGTAFGGPTDLNANNPAYLESLLKEGYNIVYGTYVAGTDWFDGTAETGVVDVQTSGGSPAPANGGHAMLLVGYDRPSQYFIFKNSWNAAHGHSGYFYLSYDYIKTYGKYGYVVKAIAD